MICLSKRKSPPFSEALQLPSFRGGKGRERAKEGERERGMERGGDRERERDEERERLRETSKPYGLDGAERSKHAGLRDRSLSGASKETRGLKCSSLRDPVRPPSVQTIRDSVRVCTRGSPPMLQHHTPASKRGLVLFSGGRSRGGGGKTTALNPSDPDEPPRVRLIWCALRTKSPADLVGEQQDTTTAGKV